ncbi:hypothetical protein COCNU_scaffold005864G000010 [Cocos nucifera]|nr:hypothetical protein [Cocos nucifera]
MEASRVAFESGFNGCKVIVGKLFSDLDLSGITQEAILTLVSKMEAQASAGMEPQPVPEVVSAIKVPQAALEVPTALIKLKVETLDPIELAPTSALTEVPVPA